MDLNHERVELEGTLLQFLYTSLEIPQLRLSHQLIQSRVFLVLPQFSFNLLVQFQVLRQTLFHDAEVLVEVFMELGVILLEMELEILHHHFEVVEIAHLPQALSCLKIRVEKLVYFFGGFAQRLIARHQAIKVDVFGELEKASTFPSSSAPCILLPSKFLLRRLSRLWLFLAID